MLSHKTLSGSPPNNQQRMSEKVVYILRITEMKLDVCFMVILMLFLYSTYRSPMDSNHTRK